MDEEERMILKKAFKELQETAIESVRRDEQLFKLVDKLNERLTRIERALDK